MSVSLPDRGTRAGSLRQQVVDAPEPKGFRVEILKGRVVMSPTPSFKHGGIVRRAEQQILPQLDRGRIAQQMYSIASPLDPDDYVSPDLVVVPAEIEDEDDWLLEANVVDMTMEVASPGNASCDLVDKVEEYASWQIPIYLLIDPRTGDVLVYSDPVDRSYRTVHKARFGDIVELPVPLQGIRIDTSGFRRYG